MFFFLCMLLIDMADVCMHVHAADENQALIKVSLDALALASPCPGVHARLRSLRRVKSELV